MTAPILTPSDTLRVYDDILQTIGKTPLVRLKHLGANLPCPLYAKVEFFNPGGSVKDRIAVNIIEEAERSGRPQTGRHSCRGYLRKYRPRPGDGVRQKRLQSHFRAAG